MKPFNIGNIQIDFPVVMAPLAGYSDAAYRKICRELDCPYSVSEMVLDRCVTAFTRKPTPITELWENESPIGGQLVGNLIEDIIPAAKQFANKGFDIIDLNFACPVNKALKRKRGGHMMSDPQQVLEIVRAVVEAVEKPVTLKVRQKFNDEDDESNFWAIANGAYDAGAAAITVHARSVQQKYTGTADWDFIKRVKGHFGDSWTVIGSGDVLLPQDAIRMIEETGVDASMAARGVLGNPWFFRQAREIAAGKNPTFPTLGEQKCIMKRHMEYAVRLYGDGKAPGIMRKFGIKYSKVHPQAKKVRIAFVGVRCAQDWFDVLDEFYPDDL